MVETRRVRDEHERMGDGQRWGVSGWDMGALAAGCGLWSTPPVLLALSARYSSRAHATSGQRWGRGVSCGPGRREKAEVGGGGRLSPNLSRSSHAAVGVAVSSLIRYQRMEAM